MARYAAPMPMSAITPTTNATAISTPPRQDTEDGKQKKKKLKTPKNIINH